MASKGLSHYDCGILLISSVSTSSLNKAQRRWRMAYTSIYSIRVMVSLNKEIVSRNRIDGTASEIVDRRDCAYNSYIAVDIIDPSSKLPEKEKHVIDDFAFTVDAKFIILMALVQLVYAAVNVLNKLAAHDQMNLRILVAYRMMFAAAATVPPSLVFESRKSGPKITWRVILLASVIALLGGTLNLNMYVASLRMTSSTFASAMTNLVPVITFLLGASFRLEKWGTAKLVGTLIEFCGAAVLTFYKGVEINILPVIIDFMHQYDHGKTSSLQHHNNILGVVLVVCYCFSTALSLIIHDKLTKIYPYPWTSTALISFMALVQSVVFALCTERDMSQWRLGWDVRLLAVAFSGIFASGLAMVLVARCVQLKGSLFVSVFSPLTFVLVAISGSLLLDEKLHLGSIIGFILIVGGLLVMIWGKSRETTQVLTTVETVDHSANIEEAIEMANSPIIITLQP